MNTDTIEFPPITEPAQPLATVEPANPGALDLKKLDLTAIALAQFGDWRAAVAKLKADNEKTVLVLPTQAKIDEAVSLRQRTIKAPLAEARKVEAALKSKLAQTSKAVGAELAALIAGYDDAGVPLTLQIDAAQKKLDDEKAAKAAAEAARLQGLRDAVDGIMAKWLERCNIEGITAERIAKGGDLFSALPMPAEVADVSVYWDTKVGTTLAEMRKLHGAALAREEAARLEAQRLENERAAAAAAAEKAAAEALMAQARQMLADAEAKRKADEDVNRVFPRALIDAAIDPSIPEGEIRIDGANPPPWFATALALAQACDAGRITHDEMERGYEALYQAEEIEAARQRAITPAAPAATEGKADTPEPGKLEAAPVAQALAEAMRTGVAMIDGDRVLGMADIYQDTTSGAAPQQASDHVNPEADAAPGGTKAYIHPDTDDHGADLMLDPGTAAAEADEPYGTGVGFDLSRRGSGFVLGPLNAAEAAAFAELEALADGPPGGFVTSDLLDACADFVALVAQARGTNFPSQPKMGPEWWTALYAAADKMRATGEVL